MQNKFLRVLLIFVAAYSLVMLFLYIDAPFHKFHAFRQSQTALTIFWLPITREWLFYQTPVLGFPWTIPFEFPTYQWIVAALHLNTPLSIEFAGRLTSICFFYLILLPVFSIFNSLHYSKTSFLVFCIFYLSSPLMITWSHAVLIESTSLFLSLSYLALGLIYLKTQRLPYVFFSSMIGCLAIVTKVTTFVPATIILFSLLILEAHLSIGMLWRANSALLVIRRFFLPSLLLFLLPLACCVYWTHATDILKAGNPVSAALTSKALFAWNFGTFEQRVSWKFWYSIFFSAGCSALAITPILIGMILHEKNKSRVTYYWPVFWFIAYLLGPLIFTNLYDHSYYFYEAGIYLLVAGALVIDSLMAFRSDHYAKRFITWALVIQVIAINPVSYIQSLSESWQDRDYQVGKFINEHTPKDSFILVYGIGWSSKIAFYAKRKSLSEPLWGNWRARINELDNYRGGLALSAVVLCGENTSELAPSLQYITSNFLNHDVADCKIHYINQHQ